ncbi:MAG TPA: OsmC family protein [Flavitalea sp.]|nr:OsmC family protein [Flavitalea sp.]
MTSTVTYDGNLRTVCRHQRSGTTIETDAPVDNNGKGERFSPSDLVATALGTCMLTIMGMRAAEMNIDLKGTKIDVDKLMKQDPRRIGGLNLTFHFPESLELNERQQKILQKAAETCPVAYSINPEIQLTVNFNWQTVKVVPVS